MTVPRLRSVRGDQGPPGTQPVAKAPELATVTHVRPGVRATEVTIARLIAAWEIASAALVGSVGILLGHPGVALVAAAWAAVQVLCLGRDSNSRGILSRRHTAARGYLALPPAYVLGSLPEPISVWTVLAALVALTWLSVVVRLGLARSWMRRRLGHDVATRVVLVGSPVQLERAVPRFCLERDVDLVGVCVDPNRAEYGAGRDLPAPVLATLVDLPRRVDALSIDQVRVLPGGVSETDLESLAWELETTNADLVLQTSLVGVSRERMSATTVGGSGVVIRSFRASPVVQAVRAVVDRAAALALLAVATPVLLVVAVLVRLDSEGPVLFRQTRVGLGGEHFTMLKFRTMVVDAEARLAELLTANDHGDGVLFKMQRDPRITRMGRFLRATSLDELPQLINVVGGQMSLIGPRPALPTEVERYDRRAFRRLAVKPGLTGLWQVSGRSSLSWADTVRIDLDYVDNWTATRDLRILLKTARAVLQRDGAY